MLKSTLLFLKLHLDLQFSLWSWECSRIVSMNGMPQACNFNTSTSKWNISYQTDGNCQWSVLQMLLTAVSIREHIYSYKEPPSFSYETSHTVEQNSLMDKDAGGVTIQGEGRRWFCSRSLVSQQSTEWPREEGKSSQGGESRLLSVYTFSQASIFSTTFPIENLIHSGRTDSGSHWKLEHGSPGV